MGFTNSTIKQGSKLRINNWKVDKKKKQEQKLALPSFITKAKGLARKEHMQHTQFSTISILVD